MADTFAAVAARRAVDARFASDGTACPSYFGAAEVHRQVQGLRRIVWVPGDPDGNVGQVRQPKAAGVSPTRDIAEIGELITVYLHATDVDAARAGDVEAQYSEIRALFDAFVRALRLDFAGRYRIVSAKHLTEQRDRVFGAGMRVVLEVSASIPDKPLGSDELYQLVPYGVAAVDVTGRSLDVNQETTVTE